MAEQLKSEILGHFRHDKVGILCQTQPTVKMVRLQLYAGGLMLRVSRHTWSSRPASPFIAAAEVGRLSAAETPPPTSRAS